MKLYCAYDKERVCDSSCTSYIEEIESIMNGVFWNETDAIPQYKTYGKALVVGPACNVDGSAIMQLCKVVPRD